eukprot:GHVS01029840.1.p1 GENE.GHVS01029840.1~~GHVS01029840.1.p1  ORF type:complete len:153 (+),score=3.66 GHVS01029840.1:191-649(+)
MDNIDIAESTQPHCTEIMEDNMAMTSQPEQLLDYLLKNEITSQTHFDSMPLSQTKQFLLMGNLNRYLATGFRVVSQQLRTNVLHPLITETDGIVNPEAAPAFEDLKIYKFLKEQRLTHEQILLFSTVLPRLCNKYSSLQHRTLRKKNWHLRG